jgi:hypothetical protein
MVGIHLDALAGDCGPYVSPRSRLGRAMFRLCRRVAGADSDGRFDIAVPE